MSDVNLFQSSNILFENDMMQVNLVGCSLNILCFLAVKWGALKKLSSFKFIFPVTSLCGVHIVALSAVG